MTKITNFFLRSPPVPRAITVIAGADLFTNAEKLLPFPKFIQYMITETEERIQQQ